jgi:hypothetical protein
MFPQRDNANLEVKYDDNEGAFHFQYGESEGIQL